jgi:hypothetical protein
MIEAIIRAVMMKRIRAIRRRLFIVILSVREKFHCSKKCTVVGQPAVSPIFMFSKRQQAGRLLYIYDCSEQTCPAKGACRPAKSGIRFSRDEGTQVRRARETILSRSFYTLPRIVFVSVSTRHVERAVFVP